MHLEKIAIKNFALFRDVELNLCPGINVIIGANATGKTMLLKLMHAIRKANPEKTESAGGMVLIGDNSEPGSPIKYQQLDNGVIKGYFPSYSSSDPNSFLRVSENKDSLAEGWEIFLQSASKEYSKYQHFPNLAPSDKETYLSVASTLKVTDGFSKSNPTLFIPSREVLSIYPGFLSAWEKRELSFDKTYQDICLALNTARLKKEPKEFNSVLERMEEIVGGEVILKDDIFYIKDAILRYSISPEKKNEIEKEDLEAHLVAEGHRKFATLVHLIRNGEIGKGTTLLWDEPETHLNPKLIAELAKVLRALAKSGVQIVLATHDYLLSSELSVLAEYEEEPNIQTRFFALNRLDDSPNAEVVAESGDLLSDLENNPILDEFAAHYDREKALFREYISKNEGDA